MGNIMSASRDVTCNVSTPTVNSFVGAGFTNQFVEPPVGAGNTCPFCGKKPGFYETQKQR